MAKVIFDGLTVEQAEMMAHWFEGQGEQDIVVWAECQDPRLKLPGPKGLLRTARTL